MNVQVVEEEPANLSAQGTAQRRIRLQTRLRKPLITLNNTKRNSNGREGEASHRKVRCFVQVTSTIISISKASNVDINEKKKKKNINKYD